MMLNAENPEPGVDYPQKDVLPEMRVDCELRHPPEDTHLMNLVFIESMDKFINAECKANCEACRLILTHNLIIVNKATVWMRILIMSNYMLNQLAKKLK